MAAEEVGRIRNVGIVGQGGVGKTFLADALVFADNRGMIDGVWRGDDGPTSFEHAGVHLIEVERRRPVEAERRDHPHLVRCHAIALEDFALGGFVGAVGCCGRRAGWRTISPGSTRTCPGWPRWTDAGTSRPT